MRTGGPPPYSFPYISFDLVARSRPGGARGRLPTRPAARSRDSPSVRVAPPVPTSLRGSQPGTSRLREGGFTLQSDRLS